MLSLFKNIGKRFKNHQKNWILSSQKLKALPFLVVQMVIFRRYIKVLIFM